MARTRFARARVARLGTVGDGGAPHLVPIVFAMVAETVVTAVDHKPKTTANLRRIRNIRGNPQVSLLVDRYEDDWAQLWWVRADGLARVVEGGMERETALDALVAKYPQYRERRPTGPVIVVGVTRWTAWSASGLDTGSP
ncbi:TIGR03668 family PPOX class F420-dependent oxidoreductase [Nonomuraea turkmeniaca]|uniref:TIGR03668 family PPOX class F420-dependent oxidoreductase n=2 Tax=Nonomuraea turkmeniaca TaxID=103838 RepID=A0A5S4FB41_9ACTN|nr:TIGR03668 family PPOX class F420-dependent oxidoreductase [Nonomuraea turkmeniaca]